MTDFEGAKYRETRHLDVTEVAGLMRRAQPHRQTRAGQPDSGAAALTPRGNRLADRPHRTRDRAQMITCASAPELHLDWS